MTSQSDLTAAGRARILVDGARVTEAFAAHPHDPLARFLCLLSLARGEPRQLEPTAMSLATVGADGRPSSRIVLLKEADAQGLTFFTNLDSEKGRAIAAHPEVALLFHWQALELQVRFSGRAVQVPDAEADAYFAFRPRESQLGAWASAQSAVLPERAALLARLAEVTAQFAGREVPRPPRWSGYRVLPLRIEFWKAHPDRLHEREVYARADAAAPFSRVLLSP
jgi:pyridoxamine 5'-phosphate oxidase